MDWLDKLMQQLDKDCPWWELHWADQDALHDYARGKPVGIDRDGLRRRVANKNFHSILHAAAAAGLVTILKE